MSLLSGSLHDTPSAFPLNSFKLLPICSDLFYHKKYNLMPRCKFWFCKTTLQPCIFWKRNDIFEQCIILSWSKITHTKHRRCYSLFSKEKLHWIYLVSVNKTQEGLVYFPQWPCATGDQHLFSINERFFTHVVSQRLHFQNKENKEKDLTGLHKLGITIQTSKVNNPQSLNAYTMCNTKLSGTSSPLVRIHLLQVLEVIQQDSTELGLFEAPGKYLQVNIQVSVH